MLWCEFVKFFNLYQVTFADTGVYECRLEFGGGKLLTAELKLNVLKRHHDAPGKHHI